MFGIHMWLKFVFYFRGPPGNPHDVSSPYKRVRPPSPTVPQRPGYPYPQDPHARSGYPGVSAAYPAMYRAEPSYQVGIFIVIRAVYIIIITVEFSHVTSLVYH